MTGVQTCALPIFQYAERNGGYTRIVRTGSRMGDAAPMAILELVDYRDEPVKTEEAAAQ